MKHFFKGRVRTVMIVTVILVALLFVISSLTDTNVPGKIVQGVMKPLRSGVAALKNQVVQFYDYMFKYEALAAENEQLKEELAEMEDHAREAEVVSRENERLRELLGLTGSHEDYKLQDAYIISWSSSDWTNTFTVNRGTNAGIQEGMCAVTANGELVGIVSEVGPNYSVVKSVLDSSMEVSATIASSGYSGMVKGGYSTGLDGLLRMNYLPSAATIRNNDQVITAGSTVYPRGLVIGNVVDAGFDDTGVAKYALIEPAADVRSLEQVFLITEYNVG